MFDDTIVSKLCGVKDEIRAIIRDAVVNVYESDTPSYYNILRLTETLGVRSIFYHAEVMLTDASVCVFPFQPAMHKLAD